ncbi:lysozyme c-1 [Nasonia vitripennis]|uniref:lysozyme n=1 Tax=Nasonia vitripennis TaxID=7425 RepID=A0A7M7TAG7_NASVI|nr:lysozyme c-1 [Nasonia vitripennis]XP_031787063.1 lysozyme c-1 [Nasonia vitripennis]
MARHTTLLLLLSALSALLFQADARILAQCDAAKELARAGIERTFISNYVCVMKSESNFDTSKKTGPGHKASYSYGIFQISSDKWCSAFRPGGVCNKNCNDFLDDDIRDDIACARTIFKLEGFKHWKGWVKSCKNGNLPNVSGCIIRRDLTEEDLIGDDSDEEEFMPMAPEITDLGETGVLDDPY